MRQFEYLRVSFSFDPEPAELDELGRQGWELVGLPKDGDSLYVFKRELGDSSEPRNSFVVLITELGAHKSTVEKILVEVGKIHKQRAFLIVQRGWTTLVGASVSRPIALALKEKLSMAGATVELK